MINFKSYGISASDIEKFSQYQKKIFFSKADILPPASKIKKVISYDYKSSDIPAITKIFKNFLQIDPKTIKQLERSTLHRVYLVKLPFKSYIIRINFWGDLYKELNFFIENWTMSELKKRDLPSLKIEFVDVSRKLVPFDYQIVESAQGQTIYQKSKSIEINDRIFHKLGSLIAKIHTIKTKEFGPFDIESVLKKGEGKGIYRTFKDHVLNNFEEHLETCFTIKAITQTEYRQIKNLFSKVEHILENIRPVLLHGDIANHNVFIKNDNISALIDWEDCLSGDPIFDIAYWGTGSFGHDRWLESFLDGYKQISNLPSDFEIRYWVYFLRISIAKRVLHYKLGSSSQNQIMSTKRIKEALVKLNPLL